MAHFAQIQDGVVTQVIVVADADCGGGIFPQSESAGQAFLANIGLDGEWRQTSYNNNFRKQYAGIGYTFQDDVFVTPQPFPSWSLDENHDWQPPVPRPEEGEGVWSEEDQEWKAISVSS